MYDIETLKKGISDIERNVETISIGLDVEKKRKLDYQNEALSENSKYDKVKIKQELENIDRNIESLEMVINKDREKIEQYKIFLYDAEEILKQHGENPDDYK